METTVGNIIVQELSENTIHDEFIQDLLVVPVVILAEVPRILQYCVYVGEPKLIEKPVTEASYASLHL